MRSIPTAVSVTLIIMGSLLLAVPAIYEMVMAAQESYVLAHNPSRSFPRHDLSSFSSFCFFVAGVGMIVAGVRSAGMPRRNAPSE